MIIENMMQQYKGEKADSVYPGYGGDPKDTEDLEDTMGIQRIQWESRGYDGDTEDTCGTPMIKFYTPNRIHII